MIYPVALHWRTLIFSSLSNYQLQAASWQGLGHCAHFPPLGWGFAQLELVAGLRHGVTVCESTGPSVMLCLENTASLESSTTSGSSDISASSLAWITISFIFFMRIAYTHACALHAFPMSEEARRHSQSPWDWSSRWL